MPPDDTPFCTHCRRRPAEGFLHESPRGDGLYTVICFDCIEDLIERENAIAEHPAIGSMLPLAPWVEEAKARPLRPPGYRKAPGDDAQLNELRRRWLESQENT